MKVCLFPQSNTDLWFLWMYLLFVDGIELVESTDQAEVILADLRHPLLAGTTMQHLEQDYPYAKIVQYDPSWSDAQVAQILLAP